MLVWGRFKAESTDLIAQNLTLDTVYHQIMRDKTPFANLVGYKQSRHSAILPLLKYEILNLLSVSLCACLSYVMYINFAVHTAFCLIAFSWCTYNGACKYVYMITQQHKGIEKSINKKYKTQEV